MIKELLFWERYRPKNIKTMVLLPRIEQFFKDGIKLNTILHGHSGTGKTTLTRILLQNKNCKIINASLYGGINILREDLDDFCTSMNSPFVKTDDKMKYVYLEEFDNTSGEFQEGFKAFVEEYNGKVRFIITMNNINKAIDPIKSRFNKISFDPINNDEKLFLKKGYVKYLKSVANHAKVEVSDEKIEKIINRNFPDLRASVQELQEIQITGNQNFISNTDDMLVFNFLLDNKIDFSNIYDFVMINYLDQPDELLRILGRPWFNYLMENKVEIAKQKGIALIGISKDYNATYDNLMVDPVIHLASYIIDIKRVLNEK